MAPVGTAAAGLPAPAPLLPVLQPLADTGGRHIPALKRAFAPLGLPLHFISAATGEGVPQLMAKAAEMLDSIQAEEKPEEAPLPVFRPQPRGEKVSVSKQGDVFVVSAPRLERLVATMDWENPEARSYIKAKFSRMGVNRALRRAGAKAGDRVRVGTTEMEWE